MHVCRSSPTPQPGPHTPDAEPHAPQRHWPGAHGQGGFATVLTGSSLAGMWPPALTEPTVALLRVRSWVVAGAGAALTPLRAEAEGKASMPHLVPLPFPQGDTKGATQVQAASRRLCSRGRCMGPLGHPGLTRRAINDILRRADLGPGLPTGSETRKPSECSSVQLAFSEAETLCVPKKSMINISYTKKDY